MYVMKPFFEGWAARIPIWKIYDQSIYISCLKCNPFHDLYQQYSIHNIWLLFHLFWDLILFICILAFPKSRFDFFRCAFNIFLGKFFLSKYYQRYKKVFCCLRLKSGIFQFLSHILVQILSYFPFPLNYIVYTHHATSSFSFGQQYSLWLFIASKSLHNTNFVMYCGSWAMTSSYPMRRN